MTQNELFEIYGIKLLSYLTYFDALAKTSYGTEFEPEIERLTEKKLLEFYNQVLKINAKKIEDIFGTGCPPCLDAYSDDAIFEFKFYDGEISSLDYSTSGGVFIEEFKLQHLELACGCNLIRKHNPDGHFSYGYYTYLDRSLDVYTLNHKEIRELISSGHASERIWCEKKGWMIPSGLWQRLGNLAMVKLIRK